MLETNIPFSSFPSFSRLASLDLVFEASWCLVIPINGSENLREINFKKTNYIFSAPALRCQKRFRNKSNDPSIEGKLSTSLRERERKKRITAQQQQQQQQQQQEKNIIIQNRTHIQFS